MTVERRMVVMLMCMFVVFYLIWSGLVWSLTMDGWMIVV